MKYKIILVAVVIALTLLAVSFLPKPGAQKANIKIPKQFSFLAQQGQINFEKNCMVCHGKNAMGTDNGPPLMHIIYEPNHHSDASFYRAVKHGVRAHHWPFGNMPAIPDVSEEDVTAIIKYVRELQQENGIK